jgi:hypothetical protein
MFIISSHDLWFLTKSSLMFCWPCITLYQYNETNMMHFSFNLLRIKGLYVFWALLAHPQEALHNGIWYTVCVYQLAALQLTYVRNIPSAVCSVLPEDGQVLPETCRGPWFSTNWMKSASRWFHYNEQLNPLLVRSHQGRPKIEIQKKYGTVYERKVMRKRERGFIWEMHYFFRRFLGFTHSSFSQG